MGQADSKFKITSVIRAILLDNSCVVSSIGDNIFPLFAPEGTQGDFILYKRDKYSKEYTKMGIYQQKCEVYINIISEDYDRSQELAELIDQTLEGTYSDPKMTIKLLDSTEDYEDGKYIQVLLFSID